MLHIYVTVQLQCGLPRHHSEHYLKLTTTSRAAARHVIPAGQEGYSYVLCNEWYLAIQPPVVFVQTIKLLFS